MDPLKTIALVVVVPAAIAAATAGAARRWRHGSPVAVALAAAAGAWAVLGAPELWPLDVTDRFVHVIAAGLVAALAASTRSLAGRAVAAGAGLVAVAVVIGPLLAHRYTGLAGVAAVIGSAASLAAIWVGLGRTGAGGDRAGLLVAAIAVAGAGVCAGLSGSVVIAQLGVAAAAGIGALWLVSLGRRDAGLLAAAAPLIAVIAWAVLALAVLYAAMSITTALVVLALPAAAAAIHTLARDHARKAAVACAVVLAAAAALIALTPSISGASDSAASGEYGYGYGYGYQ